MNDHHVSKPAGSGSDSHTCCLVLFCISCTYKRGQRTQTHINMRFELELVISPVASEFATLFPFCYFLFFCCSTWFDTCDVLSARLMWWVIQLTALTASMKWNQSVDGEWWRFLLCEHAAVRFEAAQQHFRLSTSPWWLRVMTSVCALKSSEDAED